MIGLIRNPLVAAGLTALVMGALLLKAHGTSQKWADKAAQAQIAISEYKSAALASQAAAVEAVQAAHAAELLQLSLEREEGNRLLEALRAREAQARRQNRGLRNELERLAATDVDANTWMSTVPPESIRLLGQSGQGGAGADSGDSTGAGEAGGNPPAGAGANPDPGFTARLGERGFTHRLFVSTAADRRL